MGRPPDHGQSHSPTYTCWNAMMNRCFNTNADQYPWYGKVGITVCERWVDFKNFFADMGTRPSLKHTIDRIENSGNYEPGNCRWATAMEQQNNKSTNVIVNYHGEKMTMAQAIRLSPFKLPKSTVKSRIYVLGWGIEQAIDTPSVMGRNQWR